MDGGVWFDVGGHIERMGGGECDDRGVAFGDEAVFAEAFDVEEEVGWEWVDEAVADTVGEFLGGSDAVVFV